MNDEIRLTEEMFYALLQGKKLQYLTHSVKGGSAKQWTIYPPHYGLYFTHAQIAEMQRAGQMEGSRRLIELLDKITGK